jgi:hypothetical protein
MPIKTKRLVEVLHGLLLVTFSDTRHLLKDSPNFFQTVLFCRRHQLIAWNQVRVAVVPGLAYKEVYHRTDEQATNGRHELPLPVLARRRPSAWYMSTIMGGACSMVPRSGTTLISTL